MLSITRVVDCPTQLAFISMILHVYLSVFHDKSKNHKYEKAGKSDPRGGQKFKQTRAQSLLTFNCNLKF